MPKANVLQGTITIDLIAYSDSFYCARCKKLRTGMADRFRYEDHEEDRSHDALYCPACLSQVLQLLISQLVLDEQVAEMARIRLN